MFVTFNHRMFSATGDGKYIDVMERAIYNNALSGVSAAGDSVLLRQPAGERRRWPRHPMGTRVARVLPAESRPIPGLHARLCLRAGLARRDLCEPLPSRAGTEIAVGWPQV
jgi:hypothetical protein